MPPPNDNFADRIIIPTGKQVSYQFDLTGATSEPNEQAYHWEGRTVWYQIGPITDDPLNYDNRLLIQVSNAGGGFDGFEDAGEHVVVLYTDEGDPANQELGMMWRPGSSYGDKYDGAYYMADMDPGYTYYIQIDGRENVTGTLHVASGIPEPGPWIQSPDVERVSASSGYFTGTYGVQATTPPDNAYSLSQHIARAAAGEDHNPPYQKTPGQGGDVQDTVVGSIVQTSYLTTDGVQERFASVITYWQPFSGGALTNVFFQPNMAQIIGAFEIEHEADGGTMIGNLTFETQEFVNGAAWPAAAQPVGGSMYRTAEPGWQPVEVIRASTLMHVVPDGFAIPDSGGSPQATLPGITKVEPVASWWGATRDEQLFDINVWLINRAISPDSGYLFETDEQLGTITQSKLTVMVRPPRHRFYYIGKTAIPLRQRQRSDGLAISSRRVVKGKSNQISKQSKVRQGWGNTYL